MTVDSPYIARQSYHGILHKFLIIWRFLIFLTIAVQFGILIVKGFTDDVDFKQECFRIFLHYILE